MAKRWVQVDDGPSFITIFFVVVVAIYAAGWALIIYLSALAVYLVARSLWRGTIVADAVRAAGWAGALAFLWAFYRIAR